MSTGFLYDTIVDEEGTHARVVETTLRAQRENVGTLLFSG